MSEEDTAPLARWDVGSVVNFIAVSRDGTLVASGSDDRCSRVWDVLTGTPVIGPLEGHGTVQTVAFSPDNTRLVSGSWDTTVRIWDVRTGTLIGEPLTGHEGVVYSVAFSPDNMQIASGSWDDTIRVWDAHTGTPIGEPLKGHDSIIYSVAFSHDSTRIASGSADNTIFIWDARTCTPIGRPLKGHTRPVRSVAFSHDSTHIVSASEDKTIRFWDAHTSIPIGKSLVGHTDIVVSVAFSHDSTRIVSGSRDKSICIWDTHTRTRIGKLLMGHTSYVHSVAFSPDSTHIFSGSGDGTIGVWQAPQRSPPLDMVTPQDPPSFDMVTSKMSAQDMFECLVKHGCTDLTSSTDADRRSTSVIASGGFGDVRRVTLANGSFVALKTLRLHILLKDNDKAVKRAVREVYIWSKLHHPNVQELLGIIVFQDTLGMLSPWMERGNLQQYISANPEVERYPLCIQLASGVSYLHDIDMVHGDLKAGNVLVSEDGTLKVNDFDHAILSDTTLRFTTTTRPGGGTFRWMAPELFEAEEEEGGDNGPPATRSKQTDVYALGMTMLEIFTNTVPYAEFRTDAGVFSALQKRQIPRRPSQLSGSDKRIVRMWELLVKSWDHDPAARPQASTILSHLRAP